jgi:adenosylcobinamide amidohydrolase
MTFSSLALCTLLLAAPFAAKAHTMVYTAELEPFGDSSTSQVTGKVLVFTSHNGITVAYSGSAAGLEQIGTDSACAEVNGKYIKKTCQDDHQ